MNQNMRGATQSFWGALSKTFTFVDTTMSALNGVAGGADGLGKAATIHGNRIAAQAERSSKRQAREYDREELQWALKTVEEMKQLGMSTSEFIEEYDLSKHIEAAPATKREQEIDIGL